MPQNGNIERLKYGSKTPLFGAQDDLHRNAAGVRFHGYNLYERKIFRNFAH
jgi:hypothetical protein